MMIINCVVKKERALKYNVADGDTLSVSCDLHNGPIRQLVMYHNLTSVQ